MTLKITDNQCGRLS